MPFLAECILCHQKVRVPDRAAGASVQCPRCFSYFTAAPEQDRVPAAKAIQPGLAMPPVAKAPPVPRSEAALPEAVAESADPLAVPGDEPTPPVPTRPAPPTILVRPRPKQRPPIDPAGVLALGCAAAALLGARVFVLSVLVIPLAALGLFIALVGLVQDLLSDRPRYVLAISSSIANAAVLTIALLFPMLLGPTYQLARGRGESEFATPRVVPLAGKAIPDRDAPSPEWPDAMTYAVKVKQVRLQVLSATVRKLEITSQPKKKKYSDSPYLVLRVRAHRPAGTDELLDGTWGDAATAQEHRQATLTDNAGKVYRAPPAELGGEAGELTQKSAVFPLGITDEVYLFDAPAPDVQYLRLEMPAASWGGTGTIRFQIPRALWQTDASPPRKDKSK
jgi:hypothetical protein